MTPRLADFIPRLDRVVPIDFDTLPKSTFLWKEALSHPRWDIAVYPTIEQAVNIMRLAHKMMLVAEYFKGHEIQALSWLRTEHYNKLVGGAKDSAHKEGLAIDFVVTGVHADFVRQRLKPDLSALEVRVQNHKPGTGWIHLDLKKPGPSGRFFT